MRLMIINNEYNDEIGNKFQTFVSKFYEKLNNRDFTP